MFPQEELFSVILTKEFVFLSVGLDWNIKIRTLHPVGSRNFKLNSSCIHEENEAMVALLCLAYANVFFSM